MNLSIIILCLIFLIALREVNHSNERKQSTAERKDLYDRIMSKDLQEYKWNTQEQTTFEPVSNDDDEMYEREIEDNKM